MRIAAAPDLSADDRSALTALARSRTSSARMVERARVVLLAADGMQDIEIAAKLGVSRGKVARWRKRFLASGMLGIEREAQRPGRPRRITAAREKAIVRQTLNGTPPARTHWSLRGMAEAAKVSATTVRRIWRRHGLKPHLTRGFKLSNDPQFAEKVEDIVGLYLSPPANAIVLSADEKSQIQALDRSQRGLPFTEGHIETRTHDYRRHGTTTLFAALNVVTGKVISTCHRRHRHTEWLAFLKQIDAATPAGQDIHLILDNYCTHKHAKVKRWLAKHPRFRLHYTPTGASWLNQVERFFRDISENRLRRGTFKSVPQLLAAIREYLAAHNRKPKPFIWTASATDILEKVKRARQARDRALSVGIKGAAH